MQPSLGRGKGKRKFVKSFWMYTNISTTLMGRTLSNENAAIMKWQWHTP